MRNSVVVIFGLAAVLLVTDSDSAAARSVSERARRAADGASELAASLFGEEVSTTAEESSPRQQKGLHKRSSPFMFRQSQPDIDITGLAAALRQVEAQLMQITNQVAASFGSHDPAQPLSSKRANTPTNNNNQAEKIASIAYDTIIALAKQLQTLQGSLAAPENSGTPVEGKRSQFRQTEAVPLPLPVAGEPGHRPEVTMPLNPVNLPFNPAGFPPYISTLPAYPPYFPLHPSHFPAYPPYWPYDTPKPKPLPAIKPKPDASGPSGDSSGKPYPGDETPDSQDDNADQIDNGQEATKLVYESRMDDNPYSLIPAVLRLRVKKE